MAKTMTTAVVTLERIADKIPTAYLHARNGMFYFKRKVPAKTARQLNWSSAQVWKSLGTSDMGIAIDKCQAENLAFEQAMNDAIFELGSNGCRLRAVAPRGEGTTKYLLEEHIPFLIERYVYAQHQTADEERANASDEQIEEQRLFVFEFLAARKKQSQRKNHHAVEDTANELLTVERLIAPPGSHVRESLMHALLAADIKTLQEQLRRIDGESHCPVLDEPIAPRAMQTMLDVFHLWRAKRAPLVRIGEEKVGQSRPTATPMIKSVTLRTIDSYRKFVDEFEALCGALPTQGITLLHACKYRDHLADGGLVRETVKNHFGALAAMLRVATSGEEKVKNKSDKNVFDIIDLEMVPERPDSERRRAYEVAELHVIFQSPIYTQQMGTEGQARESSYWTPILGPYVGARIEEIAQMRIEDVQRIQGVWTLRIADLGPDQRLKNSSSYRLVPLHEEVIQCGFLAYVARQKVAGHQRVFPSQLNDNKYKRWSNALGKWYSAYLDSIGLNDERLCYQSFRYSFKQQLTICGAEEEVRDSLAGHWLTKEKQKSSRNYLRRDEGQYPFAPLVAAIRALSYSDLDLSHLYVENPLEGVEILLAQASLSFKKKV